MTIHYNRPDGNYAGWGLHLWGDAIADGVGTEWADPRPPTAPTTFGAYWNVPIQDATKPVNFIIHNGDNKDPGPDQSLNPAETAAVWIKSADQTIYTQRVRRRRTWRSSTTTAPPATTATTDSTNYNDFWGMHTWGGTPIRLDHPASRHPRSTASAPYSRVPLNDAPQTVNYILHRGDTKDPGPDQFLDIARSTAARSGSLQGADPADPYILPIIKGAVSKGDLSLQQAQWIDRSTIMWKIEPKPGYSYSLYYAPDGGLALADNQISGGQSIPLFVDPAGMTDAQKAKWPQLAGYTMFRLRSQDLGARAQHPEGPDGRRGRPAGPGRRRHRAPDPGRARRSVHLHRCAGRDLERRHTHDRRLGAHGQVGQPAPV